ncbi:hypothetical protein GCM10027275_47210 [Rhabdobacter roseus]
MATIRYRPDRIERPREVWAFRSVLDLRPRMLTLALDSACYVAYDLQHCRLYKVWKGGVALEGTVYNSKKEIQPSSWGAAYFTDSLQTYQWTAERNGQNVFSKIIHKGYFFKNNQIYLQYALVLSSGDTLYVEERPEFVQDKKGRPGLARPGLERLFKTSQVPAGVQVSLKTPGVTIALLSNQSTRHVTYYAPLPAQYPPVARKVYAHQGQYLMENSDCLTCHELDQQAVGPSFQQVALRYANDKKAPRYLAGKIRAGGTGAWGNGLMNPHPQFSDAELSTLVDYIFTLKPKEKKAEKKEENTLKRPPRPVKPGYGAALTSVHPSFTLSTLHRPDFLPKVGSMAFRPDGRLLVATWDPDGSLYLLSGLESGDSSQIRVKRIATGLAEPLGMEVVDGQIYVLQKQELTHLIDHDGDEVIDEYRSVCSSWGVSNDFHEFAFGLVYQEGYFYATLSMAMRLLPHQKQLPDRGRTLKIDPRTGTFESVNYGLRTPNGLGLGPDGALFITDNQGQWLPANKLIHVKPGEYHGMGWALLDSLQKPTMALPALWLPENEIGNSPSEIVLIPDGPYRGQLLHGDVTHGGIKRDFLEKINGEYQGAVFRFSQGFEAGVNRLRWGPDGALYVGQVGMTGGGWSWNEKLYGLQKIKYNGQSTFEMLAVRARPRGFEIEFTEPLPAGFQVPTADVTVQQWWYLPTEKYGGPKMDLEELAIKKWTLSEDRRKLYLEIPGLKKERVVYLRLPDDLTSTLGHRLWSSETWYTLNHIPEN